MTKLGQHFLINKERIQQIIDALNLKSGDMVIEIGPGHGEVTKKLNFKSLKLKVIVIEKDERLVSYLKEKFKNDRNIKIIGGDALKILPETPKTYNLKPNAYKIVGNIPYYITGYLFRTLGELEIKPSLIVLTIQKEVAERVCAKPPKMNLLAASVQFWAKPEIVDYIPKKDFRPEPEVDSAIIKLIPKFYILNSKSYYDFIKILFKQPRKTILNNLLSGIRNYESGIMNRKKLFSKLRKFGIEPHARPQDLDINQIQKLSRVINYNS